jgi:hypothetical protein
MTTFAATNSEYYDTVEATKSTLLREVESVG